MTDTKAKDKNAVKARLQILYKMFYLDQVIMNQNLRAEDDLDDNTIILSDVEDYLIDEGIDLARPADNKRTIGFI